MHELSLCQALVIKLEGIAHEHDAQRIDKVFLRIGPLSGVEPALLERAYPLASAGTVAQGAQLFLEAMPVRVRCTHCGVDSEVAPNQLLCGACGDFCTRLLSGDEMLLARVELTPTRGSE